MRVGTAMGIPNAIRRLGVDPASVFKEARVDPRLFDNPDNRISLAARGRLIAIATARTGCRHFGLLAGTDGGLHSFGLVGLLVKYSPDVGTALRGLVSFFHLHSHGTAVSIALRGDVAEFGFNLLDRNLEGTDQTGDGAVALMLQIMRDLCGPSWKPLAARFAHRRPRDLTPYREVFKASLEFDAEQYGLAFSAHWLKHALPEIEPELRRLLQARIDEIEFRHRDNLPAQISAVLRSALLLRDASATRVAAMFAMHTRSLHRHLHAQGSGFRKLVDDCRSTLAQQMLEDTAKDVRQIADVLGYSEPSAFTRAFRRWTGTTPAQWRRERVMPPRRTRVAVKRPG